MALGWTAIGLSHTNKLVLLSLADNANDSGVCWPSIQNIACRCSLDERSIYRAISVLEDGGHLTVQARPGKSTVYRVHPCQTVTPDSLSPLTPCQGPPDTLSGVRAVTPDSLSPTPDSLSPRIIKNLRSKIKNLDSRLPRTRTVPEGFQITDPMRQWAKTKCPHLDIESETEKFRDHEFRDPHSNWAGAWRQWMRRAPEFRSGNGAHPPAIPPRTWRPAEEETEKC